jgi:YD repeat-containing protein
MKISINQIAVLQLVICLLYSSQIKSQSTSNVPKVIPPSPVASTFTIYGDYPVSQNTGIPDIQIPLYDFQCGDINVPIVLKYHIGSAKPNPFGTDMSNIGYGWVLDAGGIVTRTVNGVGDESGGLLSAKSRDDYDQNKYNDYNELMAISSGQVDSEYDIFNYSFNKGSGKFLIYKSGAGKYKVSSFPFVPWKWDFSITNTVFYNAITSVTIKDDKGYDYIFSDKESNQYAYSGWFLSKIKSPNNRSVNFIYNTRNLSSPASSNYNYRYDVSDYMIGDLQGDQCDPPIPNQPVIDLNHYANSMAYETKTIKEINSESGKIVFTMNNKNSIIQNFTVYDRDNKILKKVTFFHSPFNGQTAYIRLDSVWIQGSDNIPVQRYKFEYNANSVLNSGDVDYWGWYNGIPSTFHVPYTEIDYYKSDSYWRLLSSPERRGFGAIDRCVDQDKILAQTLKKIYYPTGGSTEFVFESNQFSGSSPCNNSSLGDGLRIRSIVNRDKSNISSSKTYIYKPGFSQKDRFDPTNYSSVSYTIDAIVGNSFDCDNAVRITFKRNRSYNENLNGNIQDNGIRYSVVDELFGTELSNTGKNIYYYKYDNNHMYSNYTQDLVTPDNIIMIGTHLNWGNGLLSKVETYKNESSSYIKIHEKNFEYAISHDTAFRSLRVSKLSEYPAQILIKASLYTAEEVPRGIRDQSIPIPAPPIFSLCDYTILTGGYVPTNTTETYYFPESVSTTTKNYYKNGYKKYMTASVINEGTPDAVSKEFTYPYNYNDSIYLAMVESNRIDNIIEIKDVKNGSINRTKTDFRNWGNGIIAPAAVKTAQNNSAYEERINYLSYDDKGNIVSISKTNDLVLTYLWGYSKSYPVAEIKNATYAQVNSVSPNISMLEAGNESERLRINNALPGALITYYTYKPLVGMTSQTDPNGITTYYEYDSSGRLKMIRDNDGRILKTYDYHYGQK